MFRHLHREPGFYKRLFLLALPLILQNLITTSLGFVDTFMVGMLGQNELSAVTAANTPIYLLQIIILGLLSGLSVLASQYWGKGDTDSINRCMGVSLYAGLIIAVSVAAVLFFFPLHVMALVTNNDLLIELGAPYLRIVGLSYIFNTISSVYIGMQRSTENPAMGMIVFGISMLTNTGLNYILIFGKFGAPALGITGAAIATLTSRVLEFVIVAVYAPRYRRVPLMLRLLLRPGGAMARSIREIRHPRSGERGAVGSGRQCYDRRHGPHGHQHGYAGGPRHHGQHRQVLHCGLLRHRRRHRRDCGQADR